MQGLTALQECSIKTETNGIILWNAQMGGDSQFHSKKLKNEYISMGVMQETKEIIMAIANLTIFFSCWSRWFWRQDNCTTFLVLFSYCPCDNAIHNNQGKKGNEGESYKRCRNKSLVCFLVPVPNSWYNSFHFRRGSVWSYKNKVRGQRWRRTTCLECWSIVLLRR